MSAANCTDAIEAVQFAARIAPYALHATRSSLAGRARPEPPRRIGGAVALGQFSPGSKPLRRMRSPLRAGAPTNRIELFAGLSGSLGR